MAAFAFGAGLLAAGLSDAVFVAAVVAFLVAVAIEKISCCGGVCAANAAMQQFGVVYAMQLEVPRGEMKFCWRAVLHRAPGQQK